MSITYNITTNFGAKDSLPSGDTNKVIRGSEFTTEFNSIKTAFTLAAPAASPTFTGTATIPTAAVTTLSLGGTTVTATGTELNYVDGVTSAIQTQLDSKAPTASPTFTGTVSAAAITATGAVTTDDLVINGGVNEQQYSLTGTVIDPANGTIQYKTLSTNTTFTESLADGDAITLMIDDGAAYTVTWPTITWVGGSAPTLETTGYNVINIWQVNGTLYGFFAGAA